jgi:hypothetical protein
MSSGPKTRKSTGPTSPRGIYTKSVRAPGVSLDMPDGEPVKKRVGGKIKKMAGGGPGRRSKGSGSMQPMPPMPKPHEQHFRDQIRTPVIPDPVKYPEYIEEVGEERVSGPRMRKGGSVSSASKRADGCAVRGKTRGKYV